MRKYWTRFTNFILGDNWKPVSEHDKGKKWGIYHPWKWHRWDHPYNTKEEAVAECKRRNWDL